MPIAPFRTRILLVDAARDEREMYADWLQRAGRSVLQASTAEDAYQLAAAFAPDVIVTDVRLAGVNDGIDLVRRLKRDPATCGSRIIVISAGPAAAVPQGTGACDLVVTKPCPPATLGHAITRLVRQPVRLGDRRSA